MKTFLIEGEKVKNIVWAFFGVYIVFYVFLYVGYLFFIKIMHSSFSIVSVPAVIFPYLVLLVLLFALSSGENKNIYNRRKKILIVGSILPLCCVIFLAYNEHQSIFTAEKWAEQPNERVYMVDDLLKKHDLKEMTMEGVTHLLGNPPDTPYFKEEDNIVYRLGDERGFISIDSEWLIVKFDEEQKVTEYEICRD